MQVSEDPVLIDSGVSPRLPAEEVAAWAADQRVFISSVMGQMEEERRAVAEAIEQIGATPVWFETFGGRDDDPEDAYLNEVASSDLYVGILGHRYGRPLKSGYSATHAEYLAALEQGLRISIWNSSESLDGPQTDFLEAVRIFHTTGTYASPAELKRGVEGRLGEIAAEALAPWVKVGNAMFRSTRVSVSGGALMITGKVRNAGVIADLERRRPGLGSRSTETMATWADGSSKVRVTDVRVDVTASRNRVVTISADRLPSSSASGLGAMTYNNVSPEEQTEIALRVALFREANPFQRDHMGFLVDMPNPLAALEGQRLSEDAVGQVARVLIVEALVGSGRADHITQFRIGPKRRGLRPLSLAWLPPQRYVNRTPHPISIEGEVAGDW